MPSLRQLRAAQQGGDEERLSFDSLVQWMTSNGLSFPVTGVGSPYGGKVEYGDTSFVQYVRGILKRNGIVWACMALRASVFSEVTWRFAALNDGKRGKLFGSSALSILETPWPNGTTGDLANRMIVDTDLCGNFYAVKRHGRIYRREPDKVTIILTGDPMVDEFVEVAGYIYRPGGGIAPTGELGNFHTYMPQEVCHWTPMPDPEASYRGMSWITPVLREIEADGQATDHKISFFRNGATPNFAVTLPQDVMTKTQFEDFRETMRQSHVGAHNAYKTLYLAPGADVHPLGSDLSQLSFNDTQGRDETRIAAAAGVPAVLVGLKEAMQGSSLTAGNYAQARRRFADGTMRPLYRSAAASLATLCPPPNNGSMLWYDDSQVAFFREDREDAAKILAQRATTIRTLSDAGFEPDSVVAAVEAEDLTQLVHSGLFSVQLQPPSDGTYQDPDNDNDVDEPGKPDDDTQPKPKPKPKPKP